jgi:hypothetical protein
VLILSVAVALAAAACGSSSPGSTSTSSGSQASSSASTLKVALIEPSLRNDLAFSPLRLAVADLTHLPAPNRPPA